MPLPTRDRIVARLEQTLEAMVAGKFERVADPPAEIKAPLDALVAKRQYTVRDGILALLALEVEHGEVIDWETQALYNPARNASKYLGSTLYPRLHIAGSGEALQTGVKGVTHYIDRKNETWKAILHWASRQQDIKQIERAFLYLSSRIAATARNLPAMPALDTPRLTFPRVFGLLDGMLSKNSAGAHEQFVFAALLEAWRQQLGASGVVETKNLNASDASAGTAADVQERFQGQVTEAYEVTANDFASKVAQAERALRRHDLRRAHIVARGAHAASGDDVIAAIRPDLDLTVLDVREEVRSMLAKLGKPHRREALERLYELLVDRQPDDALVQDYVAALHARGLTEQS